MKEKIKDLLEDEIKFLDKLYEFHKEVTNSIGLKETRTEKDSKVLAFGVRNMGEILEHRERCERKLKNLEK